MRLMRSAFPCLKAKEKDKTSCPAQVCTTSQGTYERSRIPPWPLTRELVSQQFNDLSRSIQYLGTRSDINSSKLAYLGVSLGSAEGVVLATLLQDKLRTAILLDGGFMLGKFPPGVDQVDFAPRLKLPVLTASDYAQVQADPLVEYKSDIVQHMNADHKDALILLAKQYAGLEAQGAGLTSVDRLGFHLRLKTQDGMKGARIAFLREVRDPAQAREVFIEMVRQAREG